MILIGKDLQKHGIVRFLHLYASGKYYLHIFYEQKILKKKDERNERKEAWFNKTKSFFCFSIIHNAPKGDHFSFTISFYLFYISKLVCARPAKKQTHNWLLVLEILHTILAGKNLQNNNTWLVSQIVIGWRLFTFMVSCQQKTVNKQGFSDF